MKVNLKALIEQKNEKLARMEALLSAAETETRAMSGKEAAEFDRLEGEVRGLTDTIDRAERAREMEMQPPGKDGEGAKRKETAEERAFAAYILGDESERRAGEQNMTMGNNGAIIPTTISNRIVKAVKDRCPILEGSTYYSVKGNLKVPVWGNANSTHNITVGYQTEFDEITADSGAFSSVDLSGYLSGALTLIGRSVENNAAFSVTDFIINQMAEEVAVWLEGELLTGTGSSAAQGALNTTNILTAAGEAAVTFDELIKLQSKVKQAYQRNACWTMHPDTLTFIQQLKDANNRYLLQNDVTNEFPYRLLGKPVYLSDNMPAMAASAKAILYGDYSGLSVNFRENISIQVLREKYATQHAIGVVSWFEFDSKVTNHQKLAALAMKAGS